MSRTGERGRLKRRAAVLPLLAALLPAGWGATPVSAQAIMRPPNLNIPSRAPSLPRINPNLGGRAVTGLNGNGLRIQSPCTAVDRDSGNCSGQVADSNSRKTRNKTASTSAGGSLGSSLASRAVANEIVAEIDGALSETQADALARRHGLRRIESRNFELLGATIGLFRVTGNRTIAAASREFAQDGSVRSVQPNLRYAL